MSKNMNKCLNNVASFLNVPLKKVSLNDDLIPTRVNSNKITTGFFNIVSTLLAEGKSDLAGSNFLEKTEIQQWLEYAIVYAIHCDSTQNSPQILKELNGVLATKTYLVSFRLTIADVVLYYILLNIMEGLSVLEKEKYLNVSRWFDNLQQNSALRQSHKFIQFNTNYLAWLAPVRH